jgi:hypothetical protein
MGSREFLVLGRRAVVVFFLKLGNSAVASSLKGVFLDLVGERARASGNGVASNAPGPSGGTRCWALHRRNNFPASPT